jgi:hypothetical protein
VFQGKISSHPGGRNDGGFQHQLQVLFPGQRIGDEGMRQQSRMKELEEQQGGPHGRAGERGEEEHWNHCIGAHRVLGTQIVKPEEEGGGQDFGNPVHFKK